MFSVGEKCRYIIFITIMLISRYWLRFIQIQILIKYIFALVNKKIPASSNPTLFRNSTDFAKVNTSKINQNPLIAEISIREKISKFPKQIKKKQTIKNKNNFYQKKVVYLVYLLRKCLKMKVHKVLERQMNIYVSTFVKILLFQAYCKQNIRLK